MVAEGAGGSDDEPLEDEEDREEEVVDPDSIWPCLSLADLKADLAECEELINGPAPTGAKASATPGEEELRAALQKGLGSSAANFDPGVFFAAQRTLDGIAADLQEALVKADELQLDYAALVASLVHGPKRPPQPEGAVEGAVPWVGLPAEECFGPDVAPSAPKPLEMDLPAKASSMAEYRQRLGAMPSALFLGSPLRLCVGEVDRRQDEKDIGRDELLVNGEPVSGARDGYAAAHTAIVAALGASGASASLSNSAADNAAQLLLSVLNRTCSGFAAFDKVLQIFNCPDVVIVSPESAAARPLEAIIIGGVALGRAHTRYAVRRADAGDDVPITTVDVEFTFRLTAQMLEWLTEAQGHTPEGAPTWPAEEITATVLLHRSSLDGAGVE